MPGAVWKRTKAKAVLDMKEFEKLCPEPQAKKVLMAGGWKENTEDPGYKEAMKEYGDNRWNYIALKSLEPSNIEWAEVDIGDSSTWKHWSKELTDAGLSSVEVNRITVCVMQANCLDDKKLEKARESFLRGPGDEQAKSSGPDTEQENTQSGEPANDSE